MYKVYVDGRFLYFPGDEEAVITDSVVSQMMNDSGAFEFMIPDINPEYENLQARVSMLQVTKDDKEIFYGEVRSIDKDIDKIKQVYAVGELAFLFDSVQPQAKYQDLSPRQMLETWLNIHNSQVEEKKRFYVGIVTVHDSNDSLYRFTNRETTLDCIREKLCDKLDGYLRIRKTGGKRYLDLVTLQDYGKICEQPVQFGANLIDYVENVSGEDIATACIPRGGKLDEGPIEGLEAYTDITSVNGGRDYVYIQKAVDTYGWIYKVVDWDDVFIPANLKAKAEKWLTDNQYENMTLDITAVDLSILHADFDSWELGDSIHAVAEPFGMDRYFPVFSRELHLQAPEEDRMQLGTTAKKDFVRQDQAQNSQTKNEFEKVHQTSSFLQSAIDNATQMMTGSNGGYKVTEYDEDGRWLRDLYMNAPNKEDATNIMQINMNGIGFSREGFPGPYKNAWTIDGVLTGEFIKAGTVQAEALSTEYRQSVEKFSEDKATAALDNSKKYTDGKLELYSTTEEVRTAIIQSADDIKLEAEQKYTTTMYVTQALSDAKSEAIQAGKNAASTAESNANKSTDEKLKLYSTTEEMRSAIDVSAQGIKLEASKIYTTFDYVGTVTEDAKDSAVKAGQEAANKAEANATKAGEEAAYQALVDARAAILLASNEISVSVKRLEQDTKHDYVTNGDFSNGLTNWEVNNNTAVTVVNDAVLGKCVKFTGDTSAYLRFTVKNIKAGKYKVRFKAAGKAGSASEARIHCRFGSSQYTSLGKISTSWTQFEYEFEIPSDNSWYMYLYDVASNIPVYIKDVEILGNYEQYNEARISIMSDKIESRVSKDDFSSYVTQYYDRVITAFNNSSKYVQISPGEIAIYDGAVSSSKKRSAFDAEGNHFWRDGYYVGKIGTNNLKTNSVYKGLVFDLEPQGKFMSWGYRDKFSDDFYTMMLYFFPQANVSGNAYAGLYLGHDLYTNGYTISIDTKGRTWTKGYDNGAAIRTKDTFWIEDGSGNNVAQFRPNDVIIVKDLYANLVGEPSDERLKNNITDSTVDALQAISAMKLRAFDWIESDGHEDIGLIAQELEKIAPNLVTENDGIKHINPTRLLWYCVKAIQQLSGELPRTALMKSDEGMTLDEKKAWIAAIRESQKPVEREPIEFTLPVQ